MTLVSRWVCDSAFASFPQSGLAWSCFLFPLIEPDWQIFRIRLSEKGSERESVEPCVWRGFLEQSNLDRRRSRRCGNVL